jgi:hypothetical protein
VRLNGRLGDNPICYWKNYVFMTDNVEEPKDDSDYFAVPNIFRNLSVFDWKSGTLNEISPSEDTDEVWCRWDIVFNGMQLFICDFVEFPFPDSTFEIKMLDFSPTLER